MEDKKVYTLGEDGLGVIIDELKKALAWPYSVPPANVEFNDAFYNFLNSCRDIRLEVNDIGDVKLECDGQLYTFVPRDDFHISYWGGQFNYLNGYNGPRNPAEVFSELKQDLLNRLSFEFQNPNKAEVYVSVDMPDRYLFDLYELKPYGEFVQMLNSKYNNYLQR